MDDSNRIIEEYISKLFEVQRTRENQPLTEQELKEIALDAGMSEEDWLAAQEVYDDHIERAEGFLKFRNWSDAIEEYKQALRIKPNNTQALASIAYSFKERWQEKGQKSDKENALVFARRCLQTSPQNSQALIIVSDLSKATTSARLPQAGNKAKISMIAGIVVFVGIAGIMLFMLGVNDSSSDYEEDFPAKQNEQVYKSEENKPEPTPVTTLPQGIQFEPSDKVSLEVQQTASEFKKLFGNRTSHHATCSFKNTGSNPIKRLKIEVTWFDKQGVRIIQRDFNVINSDEVALPAAAVKSYIIKQSFPQGKTQENYRYYIVKVRKAE